MIICNLNTLLAERNLKITKVAKDTGISRTTLTSLANNYSQGIQFETLNTLCMYLDIKPENFFEYVYFNISVLPELEFDYKNLSYLNINLLVKDIYTEETIKLYFSTKVIKNSCSIHLKLLKVKCETNFIEFLDYIGIKFLKVIENQIQKETDNLFVDQFNETLLKNQNYEINYIFDWK